MTIRKKPPPNPEWHLGENWPGRRCGAQCKRTGEPCQQPAMANGRCRMHGGPSTGPRTPEGRARQRRAVTKLGLYAGPGHPDFPSGVAGPKWRGHAKWRKSARLLKKLI